MREARDDERDDAAVVRAEFEKRAVASERRRLLLLGCTALVALLAFVSVSEIAPEVPRVVFRGKVHLGEAAALMLSLAAYAFGSRHWLGQRGAAERALDPRFRYAVGFLETSLPSLLIVGLFSIFDPLLAVLAPPTFLYAAFIALSALRLDPRLSLFVGGVAAVEYGALATYALVHTKLAGLDPMLVAPLHHLGKAVLLLLTGAATALAAKSTKDGILDSLEKVQERNRIVDVFGKHVSPEVVNKLLSQPLDMVSEVRHVCVMFLDVRGFTRFSEGRPPEEVVEFLNRLFGFMIEEITERGGIINKFLGDGFMAIFGAPVSTGADSKRAVEASLGILRRVHEGVADGSLHDTRIGIALHAGPVITGHVGSTRRREYTVIGDVVNVAARLEGMNKEHGTELLVSSTVREAVSESLARITPLGRVAVRGRGEPLEIFRVDAPE